MLTDVETSRALNALATTLKDQRPETFLTARFQSIVDGALAHAPKIRVVRSGPTTGRLENAEDGRVLASVALTPQGTWVVEREVDATGSGWAVPRP